MKKHRFDTLSFIAGLMVTGIGLLFLLPREPGDIFDFFGGIGNWLVPVLFLAVGVAVLAPLLARSTTDDSGDDV